MTLNSRKTPILILVAVLLAFTGLSSMFTVDEREMAVVVEFGRPVRSIQKPGLYFKIPMVQEVRRLPKTLQFWSNAANDVLVDLPTRNGKKIEISVWAIWRITDPEQFVRVLRTVDNAEQQVRLRFRAGVRNVIASYDLSEVIRSTDRELTSSFGLDQIEASSLTPDAIDSATPQIADLMQVGEETDVIVGREKIIDEIRENIRQQLAAGEDLGDGKQVNRGIELVDVGISNIGFEESVRRAAFERLIAFMEAIASGYQNAGVQRKAEILNQTNAEVERLLGQGEEQSKRIRGEVDAEIIELYATALRETGDFYKFQRTLQVYENALTGGTRLILTTDSDLFRMLKEVEHSTAVHE
jgi:modulator of FtsH protease HflC